MRSTVRNGQRGFSLVEITVVLAIVSALMILTYRMIQETMTATLFNESHNDLAVMSQQAVNAIQTELLQTKLVYEDDATGNAYRTALKFASPAAVWTSSVLPVMDSTTAVFKPDTAKDRFTGNSLLFVRQMPPLSIVYDDDGVAGTPEVELLADRYRFEYIYLRRETRQSFAGSGESADLMFATSAEYADYFQLAAIKAKPGTVVSKLIAAGLKRAWDPGKPLNQAFYALSAATDGTFDPAINKPDIDVAKTRTLLRGLIGAHISGKMAYSVAFATFPIPQPLSVFAKPQAALPGFPSGFEVKVIGPAGNRQVLTRIVLMANYGRTFEAQQATVVTAARF
ncbi:MAG TPA: prepilin-type N-terminal cleavage/methylation domain-containing protein [Thermoanaerobaculia bacterium]|nr:prepilin-type N-terminal cleavage/methylation domain-containing protein [Thermoanaerobaculia bacterium]